MLWRRILLVTLCLLHVNLVCSDTVSDIQAQARDSGAQISPAYVKSAISPAAVGGLGISGLGVLPTEVSGMSVATPDEISAKGVGVLTRCNDVTARKSMTNEQLAECDGALEAASIATISNAKSLDPTEKAKWVEQQKTTKAGSSPGSLGIATSSTSARCTTTTSAGATSYADQICNKTYPWDGVKAVEVLSVTESSRTTDPTTGNITDVKYTESWSVAGQQSNTACDRDGEQCTLGPLCLSINGLEVCRPCWEREVGFTCYNTNAPMVVECGDKVASNCTPKSETCAIARENGQCMAYTAVYSCPIEGAPVPGQNCTGGTACVGSLCFDTTKTADGDFAKAVVAMEGAREAGVYAEGNGVGGLELFKGVSSSCTKPAGILSGIAKNCCDVSSGAKTNKEVMGTGSSVGSLLMGSVLGAAGSSVMNMGSHYMYDFMMGSGSDFFIDKSTSAILSAQYDPTASFTDMLASPSLSMYGFTLTASPVVGGGFMGATVELGSVSLGAGNPTLYLYFNPYLLVIAVIILVITKLRTCAEDEILLSMRRGANLCAYLGQKCSKKLPWPLKTCIQYKERWCCWNSRLAKEINTQAQKQLYGLTIPQCRGLTNTEFARVDFSKLDLKYIMDEVTAKTTLPTGADISRLQGAISTKIETKIK